jgi:hypothetical protein
VERKRAKVDKHEVDEAELRRKLMPWFARLMPDAATRRLEDRFLAGVPDVLIVRKGTTFLEVKYAVPHIIGRDVQTIKCMELAVAGSCYYVIYFKPSARSSEEWTIMATPFQVKEGVWQSKNLLCVPGFDHEAVVEFVRRLPVHQ